MPPSNDVPSNSDIAADVALAALGTTQLNASRYADGEDREHNTASGEAGSVWRTGQARYVACFFWQLPRPRGDIGGRMQAEADAMVDP